MLKISASALAEDDVAEAIAYYAAISPDLVDAFEARLDAALSLLARRPDIGSLRVYRLEHEMRDITPDTLGEATQKKKGSAG